MVKPLSYPNTLRRLLLAKVPTGQKFKTMKLGKFLIYSIFLSFSLLDTSTGVLLSGMMLNYMVGSFFARQLFSSIVGNMNGLITDSTTTIPSRNSMSSMVFTQSHTPNSMDTLNTVAQVVKTLGIDRYVKDMFSSEDDCKSNTTKKCRKSKRKNRRKDSSEEDEDDDASLDEPSFHGEEDYSKYIIRGNNLRDKEEVANDMLVEDNEDPMNFYYIMKDQHKRNKKKRTETRLQLTEDTDKSTPSDIPPPHPPPPPVFRGRLPIFFRYRKRTPGHTVLFT